MLNFSKLNLTDIETVKPYFKLQLSRICDYSVFSAVLFNLVQSALLVFAEWDGKRSLDICKV